MDKIIPMAINDVQVANSRITTTISVVIVIIVEVIKSMAILNGPERIMPAGITAATVNNSNSKPNDILDNSSSSNKNINNNKTTKEIVSTRHDVSFFLPTCVSSQQQ